MPLHAFAYTSLAAEDLQAQDIDRILAEGAAFNRMAGVTGVLTFDGRRFVQCIEGPADGVDAVQARIVNARSHAQLEVLARERIAVRHFPRWALAAQRIEPAASTRIARARWEGVQAGSVGFALLRGMWMGGQGQLEPPAVLLGS
mgnify:CR=1 FL=1